MDRRFSLELKDRWNYDRMAYETVIMKSDEVYYGDSFVIEKHDRGQLIFGQYNKPSIVHGVARLVKTRSIAEGMFKAGKLHGYGRKLDDRGILVQGNFRNGELDGYGFRLKHN